MPHRKNNRRTHIGLTWALIGGVASFACSEDKGSETTLEATPLGSLSSAFSARHPHPPRGSALSVLDTHETGAFDEGAAEIVDYDAETQRVFVVNSEAAQVSVLKLTDRGFSSEQQALDPVGDLGDFEASSINSLAVSDGLLAVAVEAESRTERGRVAFYDTNELSFLGAVEVGILPDMLTFTPDGLRVLVANEGESLRDDNDRILLDPRGSVSVIDLQQGVSSATVVEADFSAFDARAHHLRANGVRTAALDGSFFAEGVGSLLPSTDLEPEYIAVSNDGLTAYITLQENNAMAVLDVLSGSITEVLPLGLKDYSQGLPVLRNVHLPKWKLPSLGRSPDGQNIRLGGLSGLWFEPSESERHRKVFYTVADRGPNADKTNFPDDGRDFTVRPHVLPNYTASIYRMELRRGRLRITDSIPLFQADGLTPITGKPNHPNLAPTEFPTDTFGNALPYDAFGGDFEGLLIDPQDRSFWLVDEYRCALYNFDATGVLLHRFVPEGTSAKAGEPLGGFGTETLPADYLNRRANRGLEAVALDPDKRLLYTFIQSPMSNPTKQADSHTIRILVVNVDKSSESFGQPVAEYLYALEGSRHGESTVDKIGDAVFAGNDQFLVIERDSSRSPSAKKFIFRIDLKGATNVLGKSLSSGLTLEQSSIDDLLGTEVIVPVNKRKLLNLASLGYRAGDKPEGLALLGDGSLAVLNDNDFGLADGPLTGDGSVELAAADADIVLGLIRFTRANGLDASDRDEEINIRPRPVLGAFMPDAIESFQTGGRNYLITANEGDGRDYDETRVKSVTLDPSVFPNAAELQADENLGRLKISSLDGDLDGDGDFDRLQAFGARSITIWDDFGNLIFDTGSLFETEVARRLPDNFNSTNDENGSFDNRSDDKGPEPEGLAIGKIGNHSYAFVGLERVGGVVVLDITHPERTRFVDYVNPRDFSGDAEAGTAGDLAPEGLKFIPASSSPTHTPLLLVANEVSGTTTVYRVHLPSR